MILELISNKCPHCHQGRVFQDSNIFTYRKDPMNKQCPVCEIRFEKEPGFFMGAMYISYGLGIFESFMSYFLFSWLINGNPSWAMTLLPLLPLLFLAPFNFRMARLVWLYLFA